MKSRRFRELKLNKRVMACVAMLVMGVGYLEAVSLDAYPAVTDEGTLVIMPKFAVTPSSTASCSTLLGYGLADHFDIIGDLCDFDFLPSFGYEDSWIMARYEYAPGVDFGVQLQYAGATSVWSLVLDFEMSMETHYFTFELVQDEFIPLSSGLDASLNYVLACALRLVPGIVDVFVEVNPSFTFAADWYYDPLDNLAVDIVPGIWVGIPKTPFELCVAVKFHDMTSASSWTDPNYSYGVWLSTSFNLGSL